MAEKIQME